MTLASMHWREGLGSQSYILDERFVRGLPDSSLAKRSAVGVGQHSVDGFDRAAYKFAWFGDGSSR